MATECGGPAAELNWGFLVNTIEASSRGELARLGSYYLLVKVQCERTKTRPPEEMNRTMAIMPETNEGRLCFVA